MLVPMHLSRILIREMADMQVIELSETGGTRKFPIVIGLPEAFAIDRRIKGVQIPRPQTHDLLAAAIAALGARVTHVVIHTLDAGTYFANIMMEREVEGNVDAEVIELDARPSDAIALAVGLGVPLYATESVLDAASEAQTLVEPPAFDPEDDEDD